MKKKLAACLAATCLAATTVVTAVVMTGCSGGGGGDASGNPTKDSDPSAGLNILLLANNDESKFYKSYFAKMEEKYNIKITYNGYETSSYYQALSAAVQAGTQPDIFYVRPNEVLQYRKQIYSLENFSKTVQENENLNLDLSEIYPLALNMYRYNNTTKKMDASGDLFAFPKDLSVQQLGYNKTIVEQYSAEIRAAGYKLPWEMDFTKENYEWDDYRDICEIIAEAASAKNLTHYSSDVPDIEILAKAYGGGILDTTNIKAQITSEPVKKALALQEALCTPSGEHGNFAAADYTYATQANFQAGKVAFYGAVASWEVVSYDNALGKDNWGVMPWPTVDGSTSWYGKITSAGYVVSNKCKNWQVAMEIAASFMTKKVQEQMFKDEKISIPMNTKLTDAYLNSENDNIYSPSTRSVFIDVISGTHGFLPAKYYTYNENWIKPMTDQLGLMWTGKSYKWDESVQTQMQNLIDMYL